MTNKLDWRYAPKRILTITHGYQPVSQYIVHPPGGRPGCPIVPTMTALELIPVIGRSQWFGVEEAKINSELRMVARGGFINPRNELARTSIWEVCTEI